jgi:hypothetical protein
VRCLLRRTVAPDYHWTIHRSYGTYESLVGLTLDERDENKEALVLALSATTKAKAHGAHRLSSAVARKQPLR